MTSRAKKLPIAVAFLAASLVTPALAQGGPGGMGRDGPGWGWHMWGGWGDWWGRRSDGMLDRIEGRLAFMKTELKITDAQAPQWNKVADAIRTSAKSMNDRMRSMWSADQKATTLLERLDVHEQFMTARLDEIKQLKGALQELYAVLGDEQKKEANNLVLPMMGMGHHGMMGGGMGPGMMGGQR
jgi:LTXXQ motif family protein